MEDAEITLILQKSLSGKVLTTAEIEALLSIKEQSSLEQLFEAAQTVKNNNFNNKVFLYGFVYFSTHCRNNCSFCFYRKSNTDSVRYRKSDEEILELSTSLEDSGVHAVDLTMGEDPIIHNDTHYQKLIDIVTMVNDAVKVPLMVSPGAIPQLVLTGLPAIKRPITLSFSSGCVQPRIMNLGLIKKNGPVKMISSLKKEL